MPNLWQGPRLVKRPPGRLHFFPRFLRRFLPTPLTGNTSTVKSYHMPEIKISNHGDMASEGGGALPAPAGAADAMPGSECPTCGRRLRLGEKLLKCGHCGSWLCEVGERALSCSGWIYCPQCRSMSRAEWLQPALPLPATS